MGEFYSEDTEQRCPDRVINDTWHSVPVAVVRSDLPSSLEVRSCPCRLLSPSVARTDALPHIHTHPRCQDNNCKQPTLINCAHLRSLLLSAYASAAAAAPPGASAASSRETAAAAGAESREPTTAPQVGVRGRYGSSGGAWSAPLAPRRRRRPRTRDSVGRRTALRYTPSDARLAATSVSHLLPFSRSFCLS